MITHMEWKYIDTQKDLDQLDRQICWDHSRIVEYYAKYSNESYFPQDICRSGHPQKNLHLLLLAHSPVVQYVEFVLIDCDGFDCSILEHFYLSGKVDSLKRVDIRDAKRSTVLRCSRLIYRFVQQQYMPDGLYLRNSDSLDSQMV